mmetsp:Transcript_5667/g.13059  ORF Transcript_5667/g.13059 Transcript_5667/m.13059 type:complete len:213 (+) Transcript_5667:359-997(+)
MVVEELSDRLELFFLLLFQILLARLVFVFPAPKILAQGLRWFRIILQQPLHLGIEIPAFKHLICDLHGQILQVFEGHAGLSFDLPRSVIPNGHLDNALSVSRVQVYLGGVIQNLLQHVLGQLEQLLWRSYSPSLSQRLLHLPPCCPFKVVVSEIEGVSTTAPELQISQRQPEMVIDLDLEPFPLVLVAPLNQIVHESVCHARCLLGGGILQV